MTARLFWGVLVSLSVGCWSEEPVIGGAFTEAQLDALRAQFPPLWPPGCLHHAPDCERAVVFGRQLFLDTRLSGTGTVSCATCHDPHKWFVDGRIDNAVSMGAEKWTARNTISLVNVGLKPPGTFSWTGMPASGDVITMIALPKAMKSSANVIATTVRSDDWYRGEYVGLFGTLPQTDETLADNVVLLLDEYMRRLVSTVAPFDRFISGDSTALSPAAIRGFGVFVGDGMCIECHRGSRFTDDGFHVTGVPQQGLHAPQSDAGRDGTGAFLTPTLRNIEMTGPYMHDGSIGSLAEVVDFYRWGGGVSGYPKDRLIFPLDIDDDDASDLVEFLKALTGRPVDPSLYPP